MSTSNGFFVIKICFLSVVGLVLQACSVHEIKRQSHVISSAAEIRGEVVTQSDSSAPIYVQLYQQEEGLIKLIYRQPLRSDGSYAFTVLPGTYAVSAYIDDNNDGQYTKGEWGSFYGDDVYQPKPILAEANQKVYLRNLQLDTPIIASSKSDISQHLRKSYINIGRIVSLDDPMFDTKYSGMGVWKPLDFTEQVGGGLMMLGEYDKDKIPLLFVHGMYGSSSEFSEMIKAIDKQKYQPWILYYPSGVNLDIISDYMLASLQTLYKRYQYQELGIIAHSMGGLMLRSYVMKQQQVNSQYKIKFIVTINSPLNGMESAARGVKNSPIVLPAWLDLDPKGDYIRRVNSWHWPKKIPFHLVFSYLPESDGDGVVALSSQLSLMLQQQATKIYGFEAQHSGILKSSVFIDSLNGIINQY